MFNENETPDFDALMKQMHFAPMPEMPHTLKRKLVTGASVLLGGAAIVVSWAALEKKINSETTD